MAFVDGRSLAERLVEGRASAAEGGSHHPGHRRGHPARPRAGSRPSRLEAAEYPVDRLRRAARDRFWPGPPNRCRRRDHRQRAGSWARRATCRPNRPRGRRRLSGRRPTFTRIGADPLLRAGRAAAVSGGKRPRDRSPGFRWKFEPLRTVNPSRPPRCWKRFAPAAWPRNRSCGSKRRANWPPHWAAGCAVRGSGPAQSDRCTTGAGTLRACRRYSSAFRTRTNPIAEAACDALEATGPALLDVAARHCGWPQLGRVERPGDQREPRSAPDPLLVLPQIGTRAAGGRARGAGRSSDLEFPRPGCRAGASCAASPRTAPDRRSDGAIGLALLAALPGGRSARSPSRSVRGGRPRSPAWSRRPSRPAGQIRNDNGMKLKLVWCPPGQFCMGSPHRRSGPFPERGASRRHAHEGFLDRSGGRDPSPMAAHHADGTVDRPTVGPGRGPCPATWVTWKDAWEFCSRFMEVGTDGGAVAGRLEIHPSDGSAMGVCVPCRYDDALLVRRRRFEAAAIRLVRYQRFRYRQTIRSPGRPQGAQSLGTVRHARQRVGMVPGRLCQGPAGRIGPRGEVGRSRRSAPRRMLEPARRLLPLGIPPAGRGGRCEPRPGFPPHSRTVGRVIPMKTGPSPTSRGRKTPRFQLPPSQTCSREKRYGFFLRELVPAL